MPASGIYATFGYAEETTWGTFKTPDHFLTFNSETMEAKKTPLQAQALHGGIYNLAKRRSIGKWSAGGSVSLDLYDRGLGLLFKHLLGNLASNALISPSTSAYKQVYTPAATNGESISFQLGRPSTNNSTIQAVSYPGAKVSDWSIDIKAGELANFQVTVDAVKEDTTQTYTASSYVQSDIFVAAQASLLLGGTATTAGGVTTVSGGTAVPLAKSVQLKATNAVDQARYVLGSYYKQEQLINGFRKLTGTLDLDFNGLTQTYDAFQADTQIALELKLVGAVIDSTNSISAEVDILCPAVFFDEDKFPVPGPQIIEEAVTFDVLDDGTNNPVQITYITLDTTP